MKISVMVIKSKPNLDGSYAIKIRLSHNQVQSYITTPYNIHSLNEWNGGWVCNRPDADYINSKLDELLHRCEEIVYGLDYEKMSMPSLANEVSAKINIKRDISQMSQRELYHEKREKYFDFVIKSYQQGMTVREIAKLVPLSKSTVQRWADEHLKKDCPELPEGTLIPRTAGAVSKQIKAMNARIAELEGQIEVQNKKIEVLTKIIEILKTEKLI